MTNGTSQGLFVVVAIVIFGIFVGLSYTIFGDSLKPALVEIFGTTPNDRLKKTDKRTWIWNTEEIQTNPDEIIEFLVEKNVGTAYLQVNMDIEPAYYHTFIEKAHAQNIDIQALSGSFEWVNTQNIDEGWRLQEEFYAWVTNYQKTASNNQRFSAIHLDIEPYANVGLWNADTQNIITFYQQSIEYGVEQSNKLNLRLVLDIPFWFDEQDYSTDYGNGKLYDWILESGAEELAIMAFRDSADGENGIIALTKTEMEKAESTKVKLSFSVETQQFDESEEHLSFAEEGEAYMLEELVKVKKESNKYNNFKGVSIHHLTSWRTLKE